MTATPTTSRPTIRRPSPKKQGWTGRTLTTLLLMLTGAMLAVPLLIVERRVENKGQRGTEGDVTLTGVAPTIPGKLDLVLVIDLSTSYRDDLPNMKQLLPAVAERIAEGSDFRIGLAGFIDGPVTDYGYQQLLPLTSDLGELRSALTQLEISGRPNNDPPEMAIPAISDTLDRFPFRSDAAKVVLLSTDAASKTPNGYSADEVVARYRSSGARIVVALVPESSASDYDTLAAQAELLAGGTGGSVQRLQGGASADLDQAILAGLDNLPVEMRPKLRAGCPIDNAQFNPGYLPSAQGGQAYDFTLDYRIADDAPFGETICTVNLGDGDEREFTISVEDG